MCLPIKMKAGDARPGEVGRRDFYFLMHFIPRACSIKSQNTLTQVRVLQ